MTNIINTTTNSTRKSSEFYQAKFLKLLEKKENKQLFRAGEEIKQCMYPYPQYWFITSKSKLYSVYGSDIKLIKPSWYKTKNKDHYNIWNYHYMLDGKLHTVRMHVILAQHFLLSPEILSMHLDLEYHVHHIIPTKYFSKDEPYKCNALSNLQVVSAQLHNNVISSLEHNPNWFIDLAKKQKAKIEEFEPNSKDELILKYYLNHIIKHYPEQAKDILVLVQDVTDDESKRRTMLTNLVDFKVNLSDTTD